MGWHAKPLPKDMAEGVVKDLQARIMNSSKRLYPATPMEDAPPVSLCNIRMPSAPAYKQGEKVTHRTHTSPQEDRLVVLPSAASIAPHHLQYIWDCTLIPITEVSTLLTALTLGTQPIVPNKI